MLNVGTPQSAPQPGPYTGPLPALPSGTAPRAAAKASPLALATLIFLVVALQFGPALGLVGFRLTGDPLWSWNGLVRDGAVALLVALAAMLWLNAGAPRLTPAARWSLGLVAIYMLMAAVSSTDFYLIVMNLRRLVLVPLLFVAVLLIPWSPGQIDTLFRWLVGTGVLVALFGLVEVVAPVSWWTRVMEIEAFTSANNFDRFGHLPFAESGRYFSYDLAALTGGPVRRMISTYLEPTTLAAGLSVLLVLALARRARGHAATGWVLLALLAGLATLSKGFWLFLLVLLAWRWWGVPAPRHLLPLLLLGCGLAAAADRFHLEGPFEHLEGLTTAVHFLFEGRWLGKGVGAAGNLSDLGSEVGEESGLGNVIGQVGWLGLVSLWWLRTLMLDVLAAAKARRDPGGPWVASWLLFWGVTYLFSASSLGVGGNALGFLMLALYLHPASGAQGLERRRAGRR